MTLRSFAFAKSMLQKRYVKQLLLTEIVSILDVFCLNVSVMCIQRMQCTITTASIGILENSSMMALMAFEVGL